MWKLYTATGKWYYTHEQVLNSPSRRHGIEPERELRYRQESASFIFDASQRLNLSIGTINTAVVYMHRFYMYHSFAKFHRYSIACTAVFLAAKVANDFRKYIDVFEACKKCFDTNGVTAETIKDWRLDQENIFFNEDVMLQTLGFEIDIELPHTHIIKCLKMLNADKNKDISRTSYLLATQMTHLTTFSLHFEPSLIACVAIHTALKWTNWKIPPSAQGKEWYSYVHPSVNVAIMDELVLVFLDIYRKSHCRMKRMIDNIYENYAKRHKKITFQEYMNRKPSNNNPVNPGTVTRVPIHMDLPKFAIRVQGSSVPSNPIQLDNNSLAQGKYHRHDIARNN